MSIAPEHRVKEFKASLEADLASKESDLTKLERERDELRRLIEEADRLLSSIGSDNRQPRPTAVVPEKADYGADPVPSQNDTPATNGSSKDLTRRQIVSQIVPEFHGETFTAGDIRHRFVQDYLEEEPPNFPQAINNLLQRMADKGEIKSLGRKGDKPGDPYIYQENENQEENLLGP